MCHVLRAQFCQSAVCVLLFQALCAVLAVARPLASCWTKHCQGVLSKHRALRLRSSHWLILQVGMCVVEAQQLPGSWGLGPRDLPLLGASPDALVLHMVRAPWPARSILAMC